MDMRIYIINTNILAAYEDYPGAWFDLPLSFEDVKEQLLLENENLIPEKLRKYVQLKDYAKELFQDEELLITSDAIFHYKG